VVAAEFVAAAKLVVAAKFVAPPTLIKRGTPTSGMLFPQPKLWKGVPWRLWLR
jgi:hypothetical protein